MIEFLIFMVVEGMRKKYFSLFHLLVLFELFLLGALLYGMHLHVAKVIKRSFIGLSDNTLKEYTKGYRSMVITNAFYISSIGQNHERVSILSDILLWGTFVPMDSLCIFHKPMHCET